MYSNYIPLAINEYSFFAFVLLLYFYVSIVFSMKISIKIINLTNFQSIFFIVFGKFNNQYYIILIVVLTKDHCQRRETKKGRKVDPHQTYEIPDYMH